MDNLKPGNNFSLISESDKTPALQNKTDIKPATAKANFTSHGSPFNGLTAEILHEILLYLPYTDLRNFALSGISNNPLQRYQSFWKRKLLIDMPWLWDLPTPAKEMNWCSGYHEFRRLCFATTRYENSRHPSDNTLVVHRDHSLVLGLANRRRIWQTCEQLAQVYLEEVKKRHTGDEGEIERVSISSVTTIVAHPTQKGAAGLRTCFLKSWEELNVQKTLKFYFQEDGRLVGISMNVDGNAENEVFGSKSDIQDSVVISRDTWVSQFELVLSGSNCLDRDAKVGICGMTVGFMIVNRYIQR
jgi:hypothetical protein